MRGGDAVFDIIETERLIERVAQAGPVPRRASSRELVAEFPGHATEVRGRGLLRGLAVSGAPAPVVARVPREGPAALGRRRQGRAVRAAVHRRRAQQLDEAVAILRGVLAEGVR